MKNVPTRRTEIESELATPTGAAIISTLADGFGYAPEMVIDRIGYGAGGRDLAEQPNLLRIYLGTAKYNYERDTVKVIETHIDDMSPQVYDLLIDKLLGMGKITRPMLVKVAAHSEAAGKKLEEAGGQILKEKSQT